MRPRRLALLALLVPMVARAGSGGPDDGGVVWTDSDEPGGPTHRWLAPGDGDDVASIELSAGDSIAIELPFGFTGYGVERTGATVTSDGTLQFGDLVVSPACPADGGITGVSTFGAPLVGARVSTATFGTYPWRTFLVSWEDATTAAGTEPGRFQLWLLESRDEAAVVLDDVTFGDPAVDGAGYVGVGDGAVGTGWACGGGVADGTTVWFADEQSRPGRTVTRTNELGEPAWGATDFGYAGKALAAGDINGDGVDDLAVGAPSSGAGSVSLLYRPYEPLDLGDAPATFTGAASSDSFGAALALADTDGDGLAELYVGAPGNDSGGAAAGAVYRWNGGGYAGDHGAADADWVTVGGIGRPTAGSSLRAGPDVDGDGYGDLLVAAPDDDTLGTNAGAVFLHLGGAALTGTTSTGAADATFAGSVAGEHVGSAVDAGDLDGDGMAEVVSGAWGADTGGTDAGALYVFPGGSTGLVSSATACAWTSSSAGAHLGEALLLADVDDDGVLDLVGAAPDLSTGTGGVWVVPAPGLSPCGDLASAASAALTGPGTSSYLGASLAAGDLDGDGLTELYAAAPNDSSGAASAGTVYAYEHPSGAVSTTDATRRLYGDLEAGALGTGLTLAADPDRLTLYAGAPYASWAGSSEGTVHGWTLSADFLDADGDGFVSIDAGGNDCADADPAAFPGAPELPGDSVDGDCDGWTDGVVKARTTRDTWDWDLAQWGSPTPERYDFEALTASARVGTYGALTFNEDVYVTDRIYGAWAAGELGAQVFEVGENVLTLDLAAPADALALGLLDPDGEFTLTASDADGVVATYRFTAHADDRPGGAFHGWSFVRPVSRIVLTGTPGDGFGVDDVDVGWASGSDRDGDGFSEADGDCDDDDATASPGAAEVLDNLVDDDCDGVIDAGNADVYADADAWLTGTDVDAQVIDFEALGLAQVVSDDYADLGVQFGDAPRVATSIGATSPRDAQAARATGTTITLYYRESQPAVALWLLDGDGAFTLHGYLAGVERYTAVVRPDADQYFVGLGFELFIDELVIEGPPSDTWGIDDVSLSVLGLDDADGDGFTEAEGDCDDTDGATYTGAPDEWYDGVDSDCAGNDDDDADYDGAGIDIDCDDGDGTVHPGADEVYYDGLDGDCSGTSDYDADADGHDDVAWGGDDCDDGDGAVSPDATETWYDGVDQDCAGDDDFDADADGFPFNASLGGDCDDGDATVNPDAAETWYDGVDQDCSGEAESDYDADGDGHVAIAWGGDDCEDFVASAYPGATGERCYDNVDTDCDRADDFDCDADGYPDARYGGEDCADDDPAISPDATDIPRSGVDEDCDGAPEYDLDLDGYDWVGNGGTDCDDDAPEVNPGAADTCYDGLDADCDGWSENDCDHDGYDDAGHGGADCDDADGEVRPGAVDFPYDGVDADCAGDDDFDTDGDGQAADWYGGTDCDDADPTVSTGAPDACYDGLDADCAGDDDFDCDRDGHADASGGGDDCDDAEPTTFPGAPETERDGVDSDCDGADGLYCSDCDGDGHDATAAGGDDCDDTDPATFPGAPEAWYDGVDGDCAGGDDFDQDGDGFQAAAWGGGDCNDADATVSPAADDLDCDGTDNNCDGRVDEECPADSGDSGETGDTGETGESGDSGETGETVGPDDTDRPPADELSDPDITTWKPSGCGCASGEGSPGALLVALAGAALVRRRRGGDAR